jgi:protein-S-isoprenylcysteine O-methyltransferase Ste14
VLLFWAVFAWIFLPEFLLIIRSKRGATALSSSDAGSLLVILLGFGVAVVVAARLARVPALRWPVSDLRAISIAGLAVAVAGSLLRRHCRRVLGSYFTATVAAQANQPVIATGAYAWMRHPAYAGGILVNTGIGIALGSWASALLLLVVSTALYGYRIRVEERALVATIGEAYRLFSNTRKRLIPYVY